MRNQEQRKLISQRGISLNINGYNQRIKMSIVIEKRNQ